MTQRTDRTLTATPVRGMTWGWVGEPGTWSTPAADRSMRAMAGLGVTWVTLAYAAVQDTAQSTEVRWRGTTVSDDEIRDAVGRARALGLRVCLKPTVNCVDGTWRAHIGFLEPDVPGEPTWREWFASYGEYVLHHAALAEELDADLFCVGCEMVRADAQEQHWRDLVAAVRQVYSGPVTYNCDKYQEDRLTWWDAVDVISASGYYPSGTWAAQLDRVERVVERHGKPFLFVEAGCPSREGSPERPNDWTHDGAPSGSAQAGYLDEMLTACAERPWVGGVVLWDWPADLYPAHEAPDNRDYCVHGKPGADVVARHFASWGAPPPA
ncbi:glycoside hydrolase family 113 [Cellulomonas carbonis]|uniref:1,4-beta-xylanase n=1 Tax=Cellulomonas carbonis T26 TaxID=947969 RepID=A0A0A0BVY2_9CELL|nr:1,4-beta-xylanase [Cellulomonas carbonis]KGM11294.1 1,4-beta-xylanase [Cellulomonas carbonis T26]GGC00963.1 hypothetical protein GCM10010972_12210 [Cellulomonas carbonis]